VNDSRLDREVKTGRLGEGETGRVVEVKREEGREKRGNRETEKEGLGDAPVPERSRRERLEEWLKNETMKL
jgi:hypothetical protein